MKRRFSVVICIFFLIFLILGTIVAFAADDNPAVNTGQVREGDFITGGYSVTNDGTVKGDLISAAQTLTVRGTVEGDIIAGAPEINLSGDVGGSIRVVGTNINISSKVSRNVMAAGSNVILSENTSISKNVYLMGGSIRCLGKVDGATNISGSYVTLGGTYNGDVVIHDMTQNTTFDILPGTVINGMLTYEGVSEYSLPGDVTVKDFKFVRINPTSAQEVSRFDIMNIIKKIITLSIYYLFALLIYKLFPRFFVRSGEFISQKPLSAAGIGIATIGTFVGGLLLLLILFLLTLYIFNISIIAFTGLVLFFVGIVTVLFADLPVSLWLGGMMVRRSSVPAKLALGLITITVIKFILDFLSDIQSGGTLFGVVGFLARVVIWLLGTGAILKTLFTMFKSANHQAESEETDTSEETRLDTI